MRPTPAHLAAAALILAAAAAPALAQSSNISAVNKYAWGENLGFMNWRDANAAAQGARVRFTFLSGYVWAENAGWIHLGNGTDPGPGSCFLYPAPAAQTGATFGVNIGGGTVMPDSTVQYPLSGFAWAENLGWINFGTADGSRPKDQWARYDRAAKRLRGYAWSENAGWINLNDAVDFVGTTLCPADTDADGVVAPADIALFVNIWFCSLSTGGLAGDFDGNGAVEPADIALFVSRWFAALSGPC